MSKDTVAALGLTVDELRAMSLENFATVLRKALKKSEEIRWLMGELLLAYGEGRARRGFARELAGELGCSTRWVQELMRTARAFAPEARAKDMTWEHHRVAACTDDPEFWLQQAVDNQWSTRQLRDAIRQAHERGPDRHDAAREVDVLIRRVQEYVDRWGRDGEQGLRELWLRITDVLEAWEKEEAR